MKISRRRAPAALAGAMIAGALVAIPAIASAGEPAYVGEAEYGTPIPHGYYGPKIDGEIGLWERIPWAGNVQPNASAEQGLAKVHYNCTTGRLSIYVFAPGTSRGSGDWVTAERLPSAPPNPDAGHKPGLDDTEYRPLEGGYEMSFPLAPGKHQLHYHAGYSTPPAPVVTAAGGKGEPPNGNGTVASGLLEVYAACPTLKITKTATGRYDHIYDWSIHKTAKLGASDAKGQAVDYRVDVKKTGPRVINRDVIGVISVSNYGYVPVPRVRISDDGMKIDHRCRILGVRTNLPNGVPPNGEQPTAVAAQGVESNGVMPPSAYERQNNAVRIKVLFPKQTVHVGYLCHPNPDLNFNKLPKKWRNIASVSWPAPNERGRAHARAGAYFSFTKLDDTYLEQVLAVDTDGKRRELLGKVGESKTLNYTRRLAAPKSGCATHANTAMLIDTGNKAWNPRSTAHVKLCRGKDGAIVAETKNPKKPSVAKPRGMKMCHVNLRSRIYGAKRVNRSRVYRIRIRNQGNLHAGNVRARLQVPRGLRITKVIRAPKAARVRGRNLYVNYRWLPAKRSRVALVRVAPDNRVVRRSRVAALRLVARHNCDVGPSRKRVILPPRPPVDNGIDPG